MTNEEKFLDCYDRARDKAGTVAAESKDRDKWLELRAELLSRLTRSGEPPQPRCPDCKSVKLSLAFSFSELRVTCENNHRTGVHIAADLVKFFGPSAPQPQPPDEWISQCPTCRKDCTGPSELAAKFVASKHCNSSIPPEVSRVAPSGSAGQEPHEFVACATCYKCGLNVPFKDAIQEGSLLQSMWRHKECPKGAIEANEQAQALAESGEPEGRAGSAVECDGCNNPQEWSAPDKDGIHHLKKVLQSAVSRFMRCSKLPVVNASPALAPKGEAMFFCGDCNAPYKLDGQAWPQMWYPTCLHKNPMFRSPAFAAAQPAAANPPRQRSYTDQDWKEAAELYGNALKEVEVWKNRAINHGYKSGETDSANPPKVEEIARQIAVELCAELVNSDPLLYCPATVKRIENQLIEYLGPFFTQVSQPARDTESEFRAWMADHSTTDYIGGELHPRAAIEFAEHYAKPVTPVSGNGTEPPKIARLIRGLAANYFHPHNETLKKFTADTEEILRQLAVAASHNGQGWVSAQTKPEEDKNVLAIGPTWIEPIVCFWDGIGWTQYETSFDATGEITHWQPLPAPPSEANVSQEGK